MDSTDQESQTFHWQFAEFDNRNFHIHSRSVLFAVVLFCIIVLTTSLFLYNRWVCHFRRRLPSSTSVTHLAHAPPAQPGGLDSTTINSFPIILHETINSTSVGGESECCICLGVFESGEKVKVLPNCQHCYHSDCVDKWLTRNSSCPLCRSSLPPNFPPV